MDGEAASGDVSAILRAWSDGDQRALDRLTPIVDDATIVGGEASTDLVALDDAMNALARLDPRKAQVVEMRFFGGLSVDETASVLKVSPVTVMRDWSSAKAWLYRELTGGTGNGS